MNTSHIIAKKNKLETSEVASQSSVVHVEQYLYEVGFMRETNSHSITLLANDVSHTSSVTRSASSARTSSDRDLI